MVMRLHKIVDREVILAFVEPGTAADDLLELDHRIDRSQQHDVAHIARIHAGREFLRRGQDGRDDFFVVLKVTQKLLAQHAIIGCDSLTVMRIAAGFHLVNQVTNRQRMNLAGAEHQRLFPRVDLSHENFHPLFLALADFNDFIEILFLVTPARLDIALDQRVIRREHIIVQRRRDMLHTERRQKTVVDALAQRIHIHRLTEIGIGVDVVAAFGRRGQAQLHRRCKVFKDAAPTAFVIGAATVTLVDDDEIEKVRGILAEIPFDRLRDRPSFDGICPELVEGLRDRPFIRRTCRSPGG